MNKQTIYGVYILAFLCLRKKRESSSVLVVACGATSVNSIKPSLAVLVEAKYVKAYRGLGGGFEITDAGRDATLADILELFEDQPADEYDDPFMAYVVKLAQTKQHDALASVTIETLTRKLRTFGRTK